MITNPVSPLHFCCPVVVRDGAVVEDDVVDEEVNPKHAMLSDPIVGMEKVTWEDGRGPGAIAARPLPSPKPMSDAQRRIHDLTHLPYDPGCPICVSCRRPNNHHRRVKNRDRSIPLVVGDYGFPKSSGDDEPLTTLIMRVYPYKMFLCTWVPSKGRDPRVVSRIVRFFKEVGLTHFAYRNDREPAIVAMIEEACALSGRKGVKICPGAAVADEDVDVSSFISNGEITNEELVVNDSVEYEEPMLDVTSHVATPELSHPGESASNGLAERSVGEFMDQLRTLKTALESRLKVRLASSHPVTHWLIEHTSYVLNKFSLGTDGHTPYGRLHGREGQERICEFGERVMWYVPKKLRSKLDQRWRYGVFLGRSMSSDQNFVGLNNGDVVCARAIVRMIPETRWDADRIGAIRITPFDFKTKAQDIIEADPDPHAHPEPKSSDADPTSKRRVKIYDQDLVRFGYTEGCQRCNYVRRGQNLRAGGVRHSEECRKRLYEAMRDAGLEKIQRADDEDSARTRTKAKRHAQQREEAPEVAKVQEVPDATQMELIDDQPTDQAGNDHIDVDHEIPDTTNFFEEVDADLENALDVDWDGEDLVDGNDDHVMSPMMDVLQCLGVSAANSANYCAQVIKNSPKGPTQFGPKYNPTFVEVYGQGNIIKASCGLRRNLNVHGMNAFDLCTCKPSGEAWDFNKSSDRIEARKYIEEQKPTWVIGCPPCTFFSLWNQAMNHRKMHPDEVEKRRKEAVRHLRFVVGLYMIQLTNGRHFLHEHPETASSWSDPSILELLSMPRVSSVVSDQCEYGLLTPGPGGVPMPAKKPTRWASSSPHMLKR